MSRPLGVAVVGCGGIARQYHLRALRRLRGVRVAAVADPDPAARAAAERIAGGRPFARAADAMERPDVDAVVVCAPNAAHADLALAALRAGRHVYVEKPLATSAADARRVVDAAERSALVAAVGLSHRFDSAYRRARALVRDGAIGDLVEVSTTFREPMPASGPPGWKRTRASGGGALLDLGVHQLDGLRWLLGDPLAEASSVEIRSTRYDHDHVRVSGRLESGAPFEGEFGHGGRPSCGWVMAGSAGWLAVDRRRGTVLLASGPAKPRLRAADRLRVRARELPLLRRERTFARALAAWVARVRGEDAELPTLRDGLAAMEDVEAIERAATPLAVR